MFLYLLSNVLLHWTVHFVQTYYRTVKCFVINTYFRKTHKKPTFRFDLIGHFRFPNLLPLLYHFQFFFLVCAVVWFIQTHDLKTW